MFINKIELRNFKNFKNLKINFNDLNVLVGANASGKSNFIQSIKFIRDIYNLGIEDAISLQGEIELLRNIKIAETENIFINIEFQNYKKISSENKKNRILDYHIQTIDYTIILSQSAKTKKIKIDETILYNVVLSEINQEKTKITKKIQLELKNKNGKLTNKNFVKKVEFNIKPKEKITFISDIFLMKILPFNILKERFDNKKTLLEQFGSLLIPSGMNFSIYDFEIKKAKESTPSASKKQLEENGENLSIVLKHIIKDKEKFRLFSNLLKDTLNYVNDFEIEKSYDKSLIFKIKENYNKDTFIPSSLLSDGTISLTALITALYFENNLFSVFEEPEQGVHPALISKLMELFYNASKNKQIFITTHNPEIVRHCKLENLLLLNRDKNGFSSINKPYKNEMVKSFLQNELEINDLFIQNLLDL